MMILRSSLVGVGCEEVGVTVDLLGSTAESPPDGEGLIIGLVSVLSDLSGLSGI